MPERFLVLRFSSIGDVLLTTPILRSLAAARPGAEIHVATKPAYAELLRHHPAVTQVHEFDSSLVRFGERLRAIGFTQVLDLHRNLRTHRLRADLPGVSWSSFPKRNAEKWLLTNFKMNRLPADEHIVERYARALRPLGIALDDGGLDLHLSEEAAAKAAAIWAEWQPAQPVLAVVLGATYPTKQWLPEHHLATINAYGAPVLLLGGPAERETADWIARQAQVPILNAAGRFDLLVSAALMQSAALVLTHDTGFMHVAAAFRQPSVVLWGNTVPAFGMGPYRSPHLNLEVNGLGCRPCSKLGKGRCPRGHFRCMRDITPGRAVAALHEMANAARLA